MHQDEISKTAKDEATLRRGSAPAEATVGTSGGAVQEDRVPSLPCQSPGLRTDGRPLLFVFTQQRLVKQMSLMLLLRRTHSAFRLITLPLVAKADDWMTQKTSQTFPFSRS